MKVIGPSLPKNIIKAINNFEYHCKCGVKLADNPVVLNADTTSNNNLVVLTVGSKIVIITSDTKTVNIETMVSAKALIMVIEAIFR